MIITVINLESIILKTSLIYAYSKKNIPYPSSNKEYTKLHTDKPTNLKAIPQYKPYALKSRTPPPNS